MIETFELRWDLLGAKLAIADDDVQAKFFKGFARELAAYESQYLREVQLSSVNEKLEPKDKETLEACLPMLWIK